MIGIVGHMSGGKTYTAVEHMLGRLATGHVVCSNVLLRCQGVSEYLGIPCVIWKRNYYILSESNLDRYHYISLLAYEDYPMGVQRGESGYAENMVYIYFDEVSSVFDSITHSANESIQKVATWARHTEKRGQMLYLIMQFSSELHKRLRNHVTEYISCVNTSNLRIPVLNTHLPSFLRHYIIRTHYAGDEETVVSSPSWNVIEPRVYNCYYTGQIVFGSDIGFRSHAVSFNSYSVGGKCKNLFLLALIAFLVLLLSCCVFCFVL